MAERATIARPYAKAAFAYARENGRVADWAFEMGSIGQVAAAGWKVDTVKPGDPITIDAYPMKDGSRGGQYQGAKLPDGRTFGPTPGNPNNPAAR